MLLLLILHVVCILLFLILGILFQRGKAAWLITGCNTAFFEKKQAYDKKPLCRFMVKPRFALAVCWTILTTGSVLNWIWLFWAGLVLFLDVSIAAVIYANMVNRSRKRS